MAHMKYLLCLSVVAVTTCMGCGMGSPSKPKTLHFVLPNDFEGPFIVLMDPGGVAVDAGQDHLEFVIRPDGVHFVSSEEPLNERRQWSASYQNGRSLGVYELSDTEIGLRGGGYSSRLGRPSRFQFFVGTLQAYEKFNFSEWNPKQSKISQ